LPLNTFYLVWNPANYKTPTYRHSTLWAALTEAERMAALYGGEFFVLEARSVSRKVTAITTAIGKQEIPF